MVEVLIAGAIALVLLAANAGENLVRLLYVVGAGAVAAGLAAGVPAGLVYHVKLYRALARLGGAERGWIWRPTSYHERLSGPERRALAPWFRAGAAGFLAAVAGCALILAAVLAQ
jgi:hypothetical protein